METVATSALNAGGEAIGIIPKRLHTVEISHQEVGDLRVVNSMHERKQMMFELSDAFVSLPGGLGTLDETFEIIAWRQTISLDKDYSLFGTDPEIFGLPLQVHHKLIIIVPTAILAWVMVTFLTKPEPNQTLRKFYERIQPGGWWSPISDNFRHTLEPVSNGIFINWISGIMMIYGFTFGIGNLVFMNYTNAVILFGIAGVGLFLVWNRSISKLD